jgi:anti-sigma regulatory factor (Ser/Thr protein kinase)
MVAEYPITPPPTRFAPSQEGHHSAVDTVAVDPATGTGNAGTRGDPRAAHISSGSRLSYPADLGELRTIRSRVESWGRRHRLPEEVLIDLQLALGEAVSNGMEHAYPGRDLRRAPTVEVDLELHVTSAGREVRVRVTDHGRWRAAPTEPGCRGRGMALIEELSRDLWVVRSPTGTQVRFTIPPVRRERSARSERRGSGPC